MSISALIKNGLILDPDHGSPYKADILIADGNIVMIAPELKSQAGQTVLDASHLWIAPGFIDLHTHLREIGQADREDISSGTQAAAAGGFTSVVAMANTCPPVDSAPALCLLLDKIAQKAHIEVLPVTTVTRAMAGAELVDMAELAEMGAVAFSDDGLPLSNKAILKQALEYAKLPGKVIISHAEDKDLSAGGAMHEGFHSTRLGLPGIPAASESAAIAAEIEVVRQTGGRLHFAHVSLGASVNLIKQAKSEGLPVTADATPHHIYLTVDDMPDFNTSFKMNPPLRPAADQEALIKGLKDGTIDAIATDHAPYTRQDKEKPFAEAAFGVTGLETAFPLVLTALVKRSGINPLEVISMLTTRPAAVLDLPQPAIAAGQPANLVVLNPEKQWLYETAKGFSRGHNSPFDGQLLTGKVMLTICRGRAVYQDATLTGV